MQLALSPNHKRIHYTLFIINKKIIKIQRQTRYLLPSLMGHNSSLQLHRSIVPSFQPSTPPITFSSILKSRSTVLYFYFCSLCYNCVHGDFYEFCSRVTYLMTVSCVVIVS